jgi:hypothetical protein
MANPLSLVQTLTTLNLAANEIGEQGARHLSTALQFNHVRKQLVMNFHG